MSTSGASSVGPAGPGFRLLAITPPVGVVSPRLVQAWAPAAAVGLAVLLREPGTGPAALSHDDHRLAALRRACAEAGVPCVLSIDDPTAPELLAAVDARGVVGIQLRGDPDEARLVAARRGLGPSRVLGRSCHGRPSVVGDRVDYSVLAPVFSPRTGTGKDAAGLEPLRRFAARERHVFALGGVTPDTARACLRAGAFGLASIRSFFGPWDEVRDNVERLVAAAIEPIDDASPPSSAR